MLIQETCGTHGKPHDKLTCSKGTLGKKKSNSYFIFIKTTIFTCVWTEETALPTEKSDILTDSKHISLPPTSIRLEKLYWTDEKPKGSI